MTKDSRRSSVAGPAAPLPQDNHTEGGPGDSETLSAMEESGATPKNDVQPDTSAESQPAIPSNTSEVNSAAPGFPTYGTRSRNRTGATRINYAEDKELDVDFEATSGKENGARRTNRSSDSNAVADVAPITNNPRRSIAIDSEATNMQNGHKDASPDASSANTGNATSQPATKKRKIAGQQSVASSVASQPQLSSNTTPTPQVPSNKPYSAPQLVPGFRETNMLGFERCGGQLKNNVLVADDGTKLQVNGIRFRPS